MLLRLWRLLEPSERRRVVGVVPLLVLSALVEVVGVAAVIPFLTVLADPGGVRELPVVGPWLARTGVEDPVVVLRWAGAALASALLLANGLLMFTTWWMLRFTWGLNHAISSRLVRHYLAQPYPFVLTNNTATLANRVVVEVRQMVDQGLRATIEALTRSVVIVALVAFLVVFDPRTAALAFVTLGGIYAAIFFVSRTYLRRLGRDAVAAGAARLKAVNEALGGFKDVRVAGREDSAYRRYLAPSRRYADVQAAAQAVSLLPRYALEAVAVGGLVLVATMSVRGSDDLASVLPLLGAYAFAGLRLLPAMQMLFNAITRIRFGLGSLEAVEADFGRRSNLEPAADAVPEPLPFEREIRLQGVRYAYPGAEAFALDGIDLHLGRRTRLAIVGRTGSGKTTLVDVLLGVLRPEAGTVLVDDAVVGVDEARRYRRLFGYVPQSIYLLDDTIERNVAFGLNDDEIDPEAVRRACREAQIAEFIELELPDGYGTIVGERGVRLSGGQRQRIGIARALYHEPEVLIFDEATSALDVHTEQLVYEALDRIAAQRTMITIAHRLDTVANADQVVVLERGQVIDQGPPTEVLRRYRGTETP